MPPPIILSCRQEWNERRSMENFTRLFGDMLLLVYHSFDRIVINSPELKRQHRVQLEAGLRRIMKAHWPVDKVNKVILSRKS